MDARHANAALKMMPAKTDRNDAIGLAQIIRTGWCKSVHVKSTASHEARALLASRSQLVQIRCDLENQVRGVLRTFGILLTLTIAISPDKHIKRQKGPESLSPEELRNFHQRAAAFDPSVT
jgi:transposase